MAKFQLDFLPDYSDEALLTEVKRVAAEVGKPMLTKSDFAKHAKVSPNTLHSRFGDWRCILERAGLGHLYSGQQVTERMRNKETRKLTDEDIIGLIRKASKELGSTSLLRHEFESITGISKTAIIGRFGSWENAARQAGLQAHPRRWRRCSDEMCYANLLEVWTHYGRCPTRSEMNRPPSVIVGQTYGSRWGSWRKALAAFVEWANGEDPEDAKPLEIPVPPVEGDRAVAVMAAPSERREPGLRLRFRVLQRDRFRCVCCGRSPATHIGVELHVDHIMPVVKGGKTVFENLRSLCKDCNIGKGDLLPE